VWLYTAERLPGLTFVVSPVTVARGGCGITGANVISSSILASSTKEKKSYGQLYVCVKISVLESASIVVGAVTFSPAPIIGPEVVGDAKLNVSPVTDPKVVDGESVGAVEAASSFCCTDFL